MQQSATKIDIISMIGISKKGVSWLYMLLLTDYTKTEDDIFGISVIDHVMFTLLIQSGF